MAAARSDAIKNKSVAFITRSEVLASFLRASSEISNNLTIMAFSSLKTLPDKVKYDTLIIDEGQDLTQFQSIDELENILIGGFENGRWRWFGDPNHQVSPSFPFEQEAFEYLKSSRPSIFNLKQNVRNTPEIVKSIKNHTKINLEEGIPRGLGGTVKIIPVGSRIEEDQKLLVELDGWLKNSSKISRNDICLLTYDESNVSRLVSFLNTEHLKAERLSEKTVSSTRNAITVSTVENFKGLEKSIICILGLGNTTSLEATRKYIYQGFSRAKHTITMICSQEDQTQLINLIQKDWNT